MADLRAIFYYGPFESHWLGHMMAEVYKDQIYRPFLPLQKEGKIALDIGGHIGIVSMYLSRFFEKVITLEPSKEHFDALKRNLISNKITNVVPINKAIYIKEGEYPFGGPDNNTTMRSLHTYCWEKGKFDETVKTITLDKLFKEQKLDHVDLMKLDVEGSEDEIISSLGFKKIADKIDTIIGEKHSWAGRHPNQLIEALKSTGFTYEIIPNSADLFVAQK